MLSNQQKKLRRIGELVHKITLSPDKITDQERNSSDYKSAMDIVSKTFAPDVNWSEEPINDLKKFNRAYQRALRRRDGWFDYKDKKILCFFAKYVLELPRVQHKIAIK